MYTYTHMATNDIARKIFDCIILIEKFYIENYPVLVEKFKNDNPEDKYNENPEKYTDDKPITYADYIRDSLMQEIEWGRIGMMTEMCGSDTMESIVDQIRDLEMGINTANAKEYIINIVELEKSIFPDEKLLELIKSQCSTEYQLERFITKKLTKVLFNSKYTQLINNALGNPYLLPL